MSINWKEITTSELKVWKPQEDNEAIEGVLKSYVEHEQYGRQYKLDVDGEEISMPSHRILQDKLSQIELNNIVKIVYVGTKPSKQGQKMRLYNVFMAE